MIIKQNGTAVGNSVHTIDFKDGFVLNSNNNEVSVGYDNTTPFCVAATSNGTTAVSVFGSAGLPHAINITGVFLISQDTTATNITVEAPASTVVCTIAKGTTAGACVGATTLSNTAVPAGTNVILDGSGAGIARVFITYTKA